MDDTWHVGFDRYEPEEEPWRESLLGLGNGVVFARACAPEAARASRDGSCHYAGLYVAGLYNQAERTVAQQRVRITALVNLPDPFGLSWRAGDQEAWFDVDAATLLHYHHHLDMAAGLARRELVARDAAGRETRLEEVRLVSMAQSGLALLRWRLTPLNWSGPIVVRSQLATEACNAKLTRTRAYEGRHLAVQPLSSESGLAVRVSTLDGRRSLQLHAELRCEGTVGSPQLGQEAHALFQQRHTVARVGQPVTAELRVRIAPAQASLGIEPPASFETALDAQRAAWANLWRCADIVAPADPVLERSCRLAAFHLLQTASPHTAACDAGLPARGWQEAYFGHVFWDELFAFPFYSLRLPDIARGLLRYRHRRLDAARSAARQAGLCGALYPWRSAASGAEETPPYQWIGPAQHWKPDHTRLQRHIGAAVAFNAWHHHCATGDLALLREATGEMLIEIARLWASIARPEAIGGRLGIHSVIGPDEYHDAYPGADAPGLDNNAYTNVMAAWALRCARELPQKLSGADWRHLSARCGVQHGELDRWDETSRRLVLPLLEGDVIAQFDGIDRLRPPDAPPLPQRDPAVRVDWWLDARGESVNAYQVTKQADVLMLLHLFGRKGCEALFTHMGYQLDAGWHERTLRYYLERVTHESSLSRIVCAGALAQADPGQSWQHYRHALHSDLEPGAGGSTHEGVHLGAMAGTWDVLLRHYLGLQLDSGAAVLAPHPPAALDDVSLAVWVHGCRLELGLRGRELRLRAAQGLRLRYQGDALNLRPGQLLALPCR